jgi:phage shock protein E
MKKWFMIPLLATGLLISTASACTSNESSSIATTQAGRIVDGVEARKLVSEGATLLDVRTVAEYRQSHVEGARHIPVENLASRMSEVGPKDTPIVVYCETGRRSANAAKLLRDQGYTVYDLKSHRNW